MCIWLMAACFGATPLVFSGGYARVAGHPWHYGNWGRWGARGYYPAFIVTPTGVVPGGVPTTLPATPPPGGTFPPLTTLPGGGGTGFPAIDPRGQQPSTTPVSLKLRDAEEISGPVYRDIIETNVGGGVGSGGAPGGGISFPKERRRRRRRQTNANTTISTINTTSTMAPPPPPPPGPPNLTSVPPVNASTMGGDSRDPGVIKFPREKRSENSWRRVKRQIISCSCVTFGTCPNNGSGSGGNFGAGNIDIRIVSGGTNVNTCPLGTVLCCPGSSTQTSCGARIQSTVSYPISNGQSRYGDYPWMVVILTNDNSYVGGGTLIDTQHVLTAAHRISGYPNGIGIKVRLGEWDASANYEQFPFRDFTISRVFVHESFNPSTLQNTVALIRMSGTVVAGTPGIVPICMPTTGQTFDNQRCWVSGWGRDSFTAGSSFQAILKAVDVPIVPQSTCESSLRSTRLGTAFTLDRQAFVCAGGELSKDACTGDGGSGLVCETSPGRWTLAGMVAWGIGCASQGVPAAYVNVVNYLPWINQRIATL